jgi:hypothetical protein
MRLMSRIVAWLAMLAVGLVIALLAIILIAPRLPIFRNFLRSKMLDYLDRNYAGHFSIGEIDGSLLGQIAFRDLRVDYDRTTVLSASRIIVNYRILPILRSHLDIVACRVDAPFINLRHVRPERWSIVDAFTSRHPAASGTALSFLIRRISIREGRASIELSKKKEAEISNLNLEGDLTSSGSEMRLSLSRITSTLTLPGIPRLGLDGRISYADAGSGGLLTVPGLAIQSRSSRAILTGAVANLRTNVVRGRLILQKLSASDVNSAVPHIGLAQDISGAIEVRGITSRTVAMKSSLSSHESNIKLQLLTDLSGVHLAYKAEAQLDRVRLDRLFKPEGGRTIPGGAISGHISAEASSLATDAVRGSVRLDDRGIAIQGWKLGDAGLTANFNRGAGNVEARFQSRSGNGFLTAAFETRAPVSYKINLRIHDFKPQRITQAVLSQSAERGALISGDINLTAAAQGAGFQPESMNARANVSISRSRIGGAIIQSGVIQARIGRGVLHLYDLSVKAEKSRLSASGEIAIAKNTHAMMRYTADVADLRPWLSLMNLPGSGSVSLAGMASGNMERMRVRGAGRLASVHLQKYSLKSAQLEYDVLGLSKTKRLQGHIHLGLREVHAGIGLNSLDMSMRLEPGSAQHCDLAINALQDDSRISRLAAKIAYGPKKIVLDLSQLSLATAMGTWKMIDSARIIREGENLEVRRLRLANGVQQFAIDGYVSPTGPQQLEASVERLDIARLSNLLPVPKGIGGALSAELSVAGTAKLPVLALAGEVRRLRLDQIQYEDVSLSGRYISSRATFEIAVRQDSQHWLTADGVLPIALSWDHGAHQRISGDLALRAKSPGIDLSFLDALTRNALTGVRGTLSLDISAQGPIDSPNPRGYVALHDLNFTVAALNVPVQNLTAQITLTPEDVRLVNLSAKAGDGTLSGFGSVAITAAAHPSNLKILFENWPAINTPEYQATAAGTVTCSERLSALHIDARTEILHAAFRPAISLSESPSVQPDHTIQISDSWSVPPPAAKQAQPSWTNRFGLENVTLNLETRIHRDTWIENSDAQVEIRGKLHVFKPPRHEPIITGQIMTAQGSLAVAGKTFTVQQGQILFTGGREIDPSLHIVARYETQKYQVLATITGTANKPELTLSSIPTLSQSDILSVLVFGKPSNQLTQGQQQGLQQQALSMAGGYAASQVGKAVAQALGLESLGINVAPGGGLGLGTYLTQSLYVSASQESSGAYGHRATMGYYLMPDLELETSTSTTQGNEVTLEWTKEY